MFEIERAKHDYDLCELQYHMLCVMYFVGRMIVSPDARDSKAFMPLAEMRRRGIAVPKHSEFVTEWWLTDIGKSIFENIHHVNVDGEVK